MSHTIVDVVKVATGGQGEQKCDTCGMDVVITFFVYTVEETYTVLYIKNKTNNNKKTNNDRCFQ